MRSSCHAGTSAVPLISPTPPSATISKPSMRAWPSCTRTVPSRERIAVRPLDRLCSVPSTKLAMSSSVSTLESASIWRLIAGTSTPSTAPSLAASATRPERLCIISRAVCPRRVKYPSTSARPETASTPAISRSMGPNSASVSRNAACPAGTGPPARLPSAFSAPSKSRPVSECSVSVPRLRLYRHRPVRCGKRREGGPRRRAQAFRRADRGLRGRSFRRTSARTPVPHPGAGARKGGT